LNNDYIAFAADAKSGIMVNMKRIVMAFGSFEMLHPGHLLYLKKARSLGDKLIVVIARDKSIELIKHRTPVIKEKDRMLMVNSLKFVDKAVLGNAIRKTEDKYLLLKKYKPSTIALGYDQEANEKEIRSWLKRNRIKAKVVRIRMSLNDSKYKSSKLIKSLGV
jgi:FAD synthetase